MKRPINNQAETSVTRYQDWINVITLSVNLINLSSTTKKVRKCKNKFAQLALLLHNLAHMPMITRHLALLPCCSFYAANVPSLICISNDDDDNIRLDM